MEKKEITNEMRAKIFALYYGCDIMTKDGLATIHAIQRNGGVHAHSDNRESRYYGCDDYKLILKPLSSITDEDAIEIAKLGGQTSSKDNHFLAHTGKELIREYLRSSHCNVSGIEWWEIQDYLRSKGYMLPYKGIDLFEAQIAINADTLTDKSK